ncbi:inorganic pyrophosphatase-like [Acanthaster planci]|uniref:Inorganic pyrophosphatase n=1 Tax=Acanthaster planci TaxID=133434 RepID=A0A8B7ZR82_ACAPL|nr:inorganic pyrophosphatase-like [Acanthaster planci]
MSVATCLRSSGALRTLVVTGVNTLFRTPKPKNQSSFQRPLICTGVCRFYSKMASYAIEEKGPQNSMDYRVFFKNASSGNYISPFHDIPLTPPGSSDPAVFNMVVEVPRWSNAKMEIKTTEKMNPIKQDVKKEKLRFVKNCFPHHGYIWNYGAFPQTWEDPNHRDEHTECNGDNDPLDVCEIGSRVAKQGEVIQVKVLGVLAMIDEGETDWKILTIDVRDKLAKVLNDVEDIREHMPGFLEATFEWFKIYKVPDGKPFNSFAFNAEPKNKDFALDIIKKTHGQWQQLMHNKTDPAGIACENVTVAGSAHMVSIEKAKEIVAAAPATGKVEPIDPEIDAWHYVSQQ